MKILIAGIGNIFLGDDGFGVEVVQRLMHMEWPEGVTVKDFGIRGLHLAYALVDPYDVSILIDAVPRGEAPGTLYTMEIDIEELAPASEPGLEAHLLDPVCVLQMVKAMGGSMKRVLLVGCEPEMLGEKEQFEGRMGLSAAVSESIDGAVAMVCSLVRSILEKTQNEQAVEMQCPYGERPADDCAAA